MSHGGRRKRPEHGSTLIDRAMGRSWSTDHSELVRDAYERTTPTERFYVWRKPGGPWQMGSYAVR